MKKLAFLLFISFLLAQKANAKFLGVDLKSILSDNNIVINIGTPKKDYSNYRYNKEENIEDVSRNHNSSTHTDELLRRLAYENSKDNQEYKAINLYERSLASNRNNYKTWHGYCWSLLKLERHNEAGKACGKAINLANNSQSWWLLGWNYEKQNNKTDAIKCYDEALKINPNNKKATYAYFDLRSRMLPTYENNSHYKVNTNSTSLRIREYPENGSTVTGRLKKGDIINVIKKSSVKMKIGGKSGSWVLFKKGKQTGYVFSGYLLKIDNKINSKKEHKNNSPSSEKHNFTIQAGSFISQKSANNFSKKLVNIGSFVFLESTSKKYIVGIGLFENKNKTKEKIASLKEKYPNIGFFPKKLK